MTAGPVELALTNDSTVQVRPLGYRCERDRWTVGSLETGEAVELPEIAVTVLRALEDGKTLRAASLLALRTHGEEPDVRSFVEDLAELGFVRLAKEEPGEPPVHQAAGLSLPWLTPRQVSWAFRPASVIAIAAFILFAFGFAIARGRLGLGYRDFFVSGYPGVSLAWSVGVVTVTAVLHEFWHLAAARSAGIPARISMSTRLIFLSAQTAAPLMWLAPRRARLCFYLAGMTCDLLLAAGCALVAAGCRSGTLPAAMAGSATLILLLCVVYQFAFCLRTDIYLVVQELLRCRNLFEDARAYARYQAARVRPRNRGKQPPPDPSCDLPEHERWPVRVYCVFMVLGSAGLLAFSAAYALPITVVACVRAVQGVLSAQPWRVLDGLAALAIEGGSQVLLLHLLRLRWKHRSRGRWA
jgi:putative peptide zinc metalloprotease protein